MIAAVIMVIPIIPITIHIDMDLILDMVTGMDSIHVTDSDCTTFITGNLESIWQLQQHYQARFQQCHIPFH